MAEIISASIAAAASLGNAAIQGKMNKKTRKLTIQENEKNRKFNWDMFKATNDYNSPAAQMARLKAAGINPHLAYSTGHAMNTSNANSSLGTQPVSAGNQAPQFDIGTVLSALRLESEIKNIDADTEKKQSETKNTEIIAGMNALDLENKSTAIALANLESQTRIGEGESRINVNTAQAEKAVQETINIILSNDKIQADIELVTAQKAYTDQQKANLVATLGLIRSQESLNYANADLAKERKNTERTEQQKNRAFTSQLHANTKYLGELAKGANTDNYIKGQTGLSTARSQDREAANRADKALHDAFGAGLDNKLRELNMTRTELQNLYLRMETVEKGINMVNPLNYVRGGSTTTTKFDKNGNYSGHSTTRRGK